MQKATKVLFKKFLTEMGEDYGEDDVQEHFAVSPTIVQSLLMAITAENDVLKLINNIPVDEVQGQKVYLGTSGLATTRTDTSGAGRRAGRDISDTAGRTYQCYQHDADVLIPYATLDSWAKFPGFMELLTAAIRIQRSDDLVMVGFNGSSVAATTDPVANPLGEDVNKGWFQLMREEAPAQIIQVPVTIGAAGDFKNLDAFVKSLKNMLGQPHKSRGGHVALIGSDILDSEGVKYFDENASTPSEKLHIKPALETYGGLPAFEVPFFPADMVAVTPWKNLSIYTQDSSVRKQTKDESAKNGIEDFYSANVAYVIEHYDNIAAIDEGQLTFV